jgi:hypothetical protein
MPTISGKTYEAREILKKIGCTFVAESKAWIIADRAPVDALIHELVFGTKYGTKGWTLGHNLHIEEFSVDTCEI